MVLKTLTEQHTLSFVDEDDLKSRVFPSTYVVCIAMANKSTRNIRSLSLNDASEIEFRRGEVFEVQRKSRGEESKVVVTIDDAFMSGFHAKLVKKKNTWVLKDNESKNGIFVGGEKVSSERSLQDLDVFEIGNSFWVFRSEVDQHFKQTIDKTLDSFEGVHDLVCTFNPSLERELNDLAQVAAAGLPLLIHGETGTGKEWIAKFVHEKSHVAGAFVPVNCGALSESLVESELFGHTKGAFSGAVGEKQGYFRAAHNGTVFLDEIGELPLKAQSTLLRVLQEKEVTPVGSAKAQKIDFRVVAASHVDLEAAVEAGEFRADLFQRLCGHRVSALSLRDRKEDLGLLMRNICFRIDPSWNGALTRNAMRELATYAWPGNIRELEHNLRTAMALCAEQCITLDDIKNLKSELPGNAVDKESNSDRKEELLKLLQKHNGNVSAVARDFGKARVQIRRWCTKYNIDPDSFR